MPAEIGNGLRLRSRLLEREAKNVGVPADVIDASCEVERVSIGGEMRTARPGPCSAREFHRIATLSVDTDEPIRVRNLIGPLEHDALAVGTPAREERPGCARE